MKSPLIIAFSLALSACGSTPTVTYEIPDAHSSTITVTDVRGNTPEKTQTLPSGQGEITVLGASAIRPSPARLLEVRANEQLSGHPGPLDLRLTHFEARIYESKVPINKTAVDIATTAINDPIASKLARLILGAASLSKGDKKIEVLVFGDVNGRGFDGYGERRVAGGAVTEAIIKEAIDEALNRALTSVRRALSESTAYSRY